MGLGLALLRRETSMMLKPHAAYARRFNTRRLRPQQPDPRPEWVDDVKFALLAFGCGALAVVVVAMDVALVSAIIRACS